MTDRQRDRIWQMRADGCGYIKIAQELGISENTVKSFCRRKGLNGAAAAADTPVSLVEGEKGICPCCGAEVRQDPGRKAKKFCSDKCRNKWWNSHQDRVKRRAHYEFVCACCKNHSRPTETPAGNIAPMRVMWLTGPGVARMSEEQFRNEKMYHATMAWALSGTEISPYYERCFFQIGGIACR